MILKIKYQICCFHLQKSWFVGKRKINIKEILTSHSRNHITLQHLFDMVPICLSQIWPQFNENLRNPLIWYWPLNVVGWDVLLHALWLVSVRWPKTATRAKVFFLTYEIFTSLARKRQNRRHYFNYAVILRNRRNRRNYFNYSVILLTTNNSDFSHHSNVCILLSYVTSWDTRTIIIHDNDFNS